MYSASAHVKTRIVMERQILFSKLMSTNTDVKTEETNPNDITARSYHMQGHAQKCFERCCEWAQAHQTIDQLPKVSTPCLDDHQVKPNDLEMVGELSETFYQIVCRCWKTRFILDIKLFGKISERAIFDLTVGCKLGSLQDADFAGNLTHSKSTSGGVQMYVFADFMGLQETNNCIPEQH